MKQFEDRLLNHGILILEAGSGCIASSALLPLCRVATVARFKALKAAWWGLTSIVICCIILLFLAVATRAGSPAHTADLAEAVIHVLGSSFVLAVAHLSLRAAEDLTRLGALEEAAHLDFLTGLANRRRMSQRLDEEVGRAQPGGRPLSVIMLDVDHFKNVNDAHGHAAGDRVIQEVAKLLSANVTYTDLVCRFGGEEFAVIVPKLEPSAVGALAERLRSVIAQAAIPMQSGTPIKVTVSLGVASLKPEEHGLQLMGRADVALYDAKRSGRDRFLEAA